MITRKLHSILVAALEKAPVISITGPRQSGKTTLVKAVFEGFTYINFEDLCQLLHGLGFQERIRGSHYIYTKDGVMEIINLQAKGSTAKPYQVKQVRNLILKHKLAGEND